MCHILPSHHIKVLSHIKENTEVGVKSVVAPNSFLKELQAETKRVKLTEYGNLRVAWVINLAHFNALLFEVPFQFSSVIHIHVVLVLGSQAPAQNKL